MQDPGQAEPCYPDAFKLGSPGPMLLHLVQVTCLSCLNVRVRKRRRVLQPLRDKLLIRKA